MLSPFFKIGCETVELISTAAVRAPTLTPWCANSQHAQYGRAELKSQYFFIYSKVRYN